MRILLVLPVLLALASCVRGGLEAGRDGVDGAGDGSEMNGGTEQSAENAYYFVFDIDTGRNNPQTRATYDDADGNNAGDAEYVYGTEDEHRIGSAGNYVFFFDGNSVLKAVSLLTLDRNHADFVPGTDDGNKIEARYTTILRSTDKDFPKAGWRVLLVFNGQRVYDALTSRFLPESATEDKVLSFVWEETTDPTRIGRNDDGLFVMTNSVYVDGSGVYAAVPITEKMIHTIEDISQEIPDPDLEPDQILTIRVERMVSKFSLELENNDGSYFIAQNPKIADADEILLCTGWTKTENDYAPILESVKWRTNILGWGMNAFETQSHLFKNIENSEYFSGWNDAASFRSYWAEDPHYKDDYAWQYRWAVDCKLNWYGNEDASWKNLLVNYPWTHFTNQPGQEHIVYSPENTYDSVFLSDHLDNRTELLAGTHLIVRAQLEIDRNGDGNYQIVEPLYRDRTGVFYTSARDCVWGLVRAFNNELASQTKMQYRYYDWSKTVDPSTLFAVPTVTYDKTATNLDDRFKLYYEGKELTYDYIMNTWGEQKCRELLAEAYIKNGDGKRLLDTKGFSIRKRDGTNLPIYSRYDVGVDDAWNDYDNSPYLVERTNDQQANDVRSLIFEWAGAVDYFQDGMMYYAAPTAIVKETVYGAVRNAWYRFKIKGINNIGIPVHDADMPIVPNGEDPYYRMNVKVELLPWHEINQNIPIIPFS